MDTKSIGLATASVSMSIGTPCMICGSTVTMLHPGDSLKICDNCKSAVMTVRYLTENGVLDALIKLLD